MFVNQDIHRQLLSGLRHIKYKRIRLGNRSICIRKTSGKIVVSVYLTAQRAINIESRYEKHTIIIFKDCYTMYPLQF